MKYIGRVVTPVRGSVYEVYEGGDRFYVKGGGKGRLFKLSKETYRRILSWLEGRLLPDRYFKLARRAQEEGVTSVGTFFLFLIVGEALGEVEYYQKGKEALVKLK